MPTHHPCGSLPVTGIMLNAWYCHHHQAWFAFASRHTEDGEEGFVDGQTRQVEFGPFDDVRDVRAWLVTAASELVVDPHMSVGS